MTAVSAIPFKTPYNRPGISVLDYADGQPIGNGVLYADDAFAAALAAAAAVDGGSRGRIVYMPYGHYTFSKPVRVPASVMLMGDGGHGYENAATRLLFDDGQHGIIVESQYSGGSASSKGDGTWLMNFFIGANGSTLGFKHGITARSKVICVNVWVGANEGPYVKGFSGHAFNIASGDLNVNDAKRWWKTLNTYTIGDLVRQPGASRNLMTSTTGTLAVTAAGDIDGTISVQRSVAWDNIPPTGVGITNSFLIPAGSAIAGASNENVGWYLVESVTSSGLVGRKLSDTPYLVTSAFTDPVSVGATAYAAGAVSAYNEDGLHYICRTAGVSSGGPTGTGTGITDGTVIWDYISYLGNANEWNLSNCTAVACGGCGLFTDGDNVNTGESRRFSASLCGQWGIFDYCFFGNAHYSAHTAANVGSYRNFASNNQYGYVNVAGYYEAGQLPEYVASPGSSVFGIKGVGQQYDSRSTGFRQTAGQMSTHYTDSTAGGKTLRAIVGPSIATGAFSATHTDDSQGIYLGHFSSTNWGFGNVGYQPSFELLGGQYGGMFRAFYPFVTAFQGQTGAPVGAGGQLFAANGNPLIAATGGGVYGVRNSLEKGAISLNQDQTIGNPALYVAAENCGSGTAWSSGAVYQSGGTTTPTAPNGYVYRVTSGSTSGTTGVAEPTWPTTLGATVTESTGLKWTCFGYDGTNPALPYPLDSIYSVTRFQDDTSAPSTAYTQNVRRGRFTLMAGEHVVTITNNTCMKAGDHISCTMEDLDATATHYRAKALGVIGAGGFIFEVNSNATGPINITWQNLS